MKKLGQKTGAIGALLFALIPAFFMAACSTDAAVDAAAVTAALNVEKAKYQTAIDLSGATATEKGTDVSDTVVQLVTGKYADNSITRGILRTSSGQMVLNETKKLMLPSVEEKTAGTETEGQNDAEKAEIPWRTAMKDIQVVILQFEKDGVTSYLDVLCAFEANNSPVKDTWLGYGFDKGASTVKNPVLDLAKLNAAGWITPPDSGTESLRYTAPDPLAQLAAQSFIDDILSGKTPGELQAAYGTHLIVKVKTGGPTAGKLGTVDNNDLISLLDMAESVKNMHSWTEQDQDYYRQTVSSSTWVSAVDILTYDKKQSSLNLRTGWYSAVNIWTAEQWLDYSANWGKRNGGAPEPEDFNLWAGGKYIYGIFKVSDCPRDAIEDLVVIEGKDAKAPAGYTKINVDLNKGCGASTPYLYLCYKPVNQYSKEAISWVGAHYWWYAIKNSPPHKEYDEVFVGGGRRWWGTDAERDSVRWVKFNGETQNTPADLNKGMAFSMNVYLYMEKKPFKW